MAVSPLYFVLYFLPCRDFFVRTETKLDVCLECRGHADGARKALSCRDASRRSPKSSKWWDAWFGPFMISQTATFSSIGVRDGGVYMGIRGKDRGKLPSIQC